MMGTDVNCRVNNDGADGIGVEAFDLLGGGAESEKEKAEGQKKIFCHLFCFVVIMVGTLFAIAPFLI